MQSGAVPKGARGQSQNSSISKAEAASTLLEPDDWADLREENMINPAPVLGRFSGPSGPRPAPGDPGTAPARKIVQIGAKIKPGDQL